MFRHRIRWWMIAIALLVPACEENIDGYDCPQVPLNSNLQHVLYWGEVESDVCTYRANKGYPVHAVGIPRWIADDAILTGRGILRNCEFESGIIRVNVDPVTRVFKGVTRFVYDGNMTIRTYDWLPETSELVLVYAEDTWDSRISKATLDNGQLLLQPVVVGTDWQPGGVSHWPGHDGFVFYGWNLADSRAGFYWSSATAAEPDSLLLETDYFMEGTHPFDFSSDGTLLYAGFSPDVYSDTCIVNEHNLANGASRKVFQGRGNFVALDVSEDGTRLLLNRLAWTEPDVYIDIVDLETGRTSRVDVRTYECTWTYVVALFPTWSPNGNSFAFLGGWGSGEGDYAPHELWIRKLAR